MSDKKEPLLVVKNLKQHFPTTSGGLFSKVNGAIRAVDGISFELNAGETLGIVGESGCGKSTTVRSIAQLYRPTSGEVFFDGTDLCKSSEKELARARRDIQMIFQDPYASLDPRMTVRSIIAEPLQIFNKRGLLDTKMTNLEIEDEVEKLMERVGLNKAFKNRYPHEFSGGQRQRIGIARALALNPKIILADEPVSDHQDQSPDRVRRCVCRAHGGPGQSEAGHGGRPPEPSAHACHGPQCGRRDRIGGHRRCAADITEPGDLKGGII